jgi:hypothetical protein
VSAEGDGRTAPVSAASILAFQLTSGGDEHGVPDTTLLAIPTRTRRSPLRTSRISEPAGAARARAKGEMIVTKLTIADIADEMFRVFELEGEALGVTMEDLHNRVKAQEADLLGCVLHHTAS